MRANELLSQLAVLGQNLKTIDEAIESQTKKSGKFNTVTGEEWIDGIGPAEEKWLKQSWSSELIKVK